MRIALRFACSLSLVAIAAHTSPAFGQTINRKVESVLITTGSAPGLFNVGADVSTTSFTGASIDASAEYEVLVNGLSAGPSIGRDLSVPASVGCSMSTPPCAGKSCPSVSWGGGPGVAGTCVTEGATCGCRWSQKKNNLAVDVVLGGGDTVTVRVSAAFGAEPETITTDDELTITFPGTGIPAMPPWAVAALVLGLALAAVRLTRSQGLASSS